MEAKKRGRKASLETGGKNLMVYLEPKHLERIEQLGKVYNISNKTAVIRLCIENHLL
jgi:hypothetical protein